MKRLLAIALGAAVMLFVAAAAFAFTKYPPGPNPPGTCTDTLSIYQVKNAILNHLGACQPVEDLTKAGSLSQEVCKRHQAAAL